MKYREDANLDATQINDQRSGGTRTSGSSASRSMGVYVGAGGGIVGLIAVLLFSVLDSGTGSLQGSSAVGSTPVAAQQAGGDLATNCRTGADANQRTDCRTLAAVNSIQSYWTSALSANNPHYRKSPTVLFDGSVRTGCGNATSASGPFYCPADQTVYIDLGFYDQLRRDFGAKGGTFAEAYVLAHEYGHHVQHLLGFDTLVGRDRQGATSGSVRLELQADCFAGVWAANAESTGFIEPLTRADVADGLDAAAAIGDDRIQSSAGQRVQPESFTHGTSAQRQRWFETGYQTRDPNRCDTWSAGV